MTKYENISINVQSEWYKNLQYFTKSNIIYLKRMEIIPFKLQKQKKNKIH